MVGSDNGRIALTGRRLELLRDRLANEEREQAMARPAMRKAALSEAIGAARLTLAQARQLADLAQTKNEKALAKRAIRVAVASLSIAERDYTIEVRGEQVAPAAQRHGVTQRNARMTDADGIMVVGDVELREGRVVVSSRGRSELQPALERLFRRETIDARCYRAGARYRDAWETAGIDQFPSALGSTDQAKGVPKSGNRRIEQAAWSSYDLDSARHAVGRFGTAVLEHLVIDGLTIASWAERQAQSEHVAKGIVIMVLKRLAEHWDELDSNPESQPQPIEDDDENDDA